ncbi:hypothetical protein ACHAXA_003585 [Cyclostephanos tholiformis]|uniref:RanBP2-type domain-containing protein n=1 Tax=Cyclostephanos tholiformis TaxID=382380 RepID=A0ABD3RSP2_9STRA
MEDIGTEEEAKPPAPAKPVGGRTQQLRILPSPPSSSGGGLPRCSPQDASSPSLPAAVTVSSYYSPSPAISPGGGPEWTDFERSRLPCDVSCPLTMTTKTNASDTNVSDRRNRSTKKRTIGRRRDRDILEVPECDDHPDEDEVVFISSSQGEGMVVSTPNDTRRLGAGSHFPVRSRRDPNNFPSPRVADVANIRSSNDVRDVDGNFLLGDCNELDAQLKSELEPRLKPDVKTEDAFNEDDGLSLSDLGPPSLSIVKSEPVREKRLDARVSFCYDQSYWRCRNCGGLNSPTARCGTCRHFKERKRTSETVLLERTRSELLSGRDFWICTRCEIAMPSLTTPCGGCQKLISFVPLKLDEFEEFVRKQRQTGAYLRLGHAHRKDTHISHGPVV